MSIALYTGVNDALQMTRSPATGAFFDCNVLFMRTGTHLGQLAHVEEVMEFCGGRQHLGLNLVPQRDCERHQLGCHVDNLRAEGGGIKSALVQKQKDSHFSSLVRAIEYHCICSSAGSQNQNRTCFPPVNCIQDLSVHAKKQFEGRVMDRQCVRVGRSKKRIEGPTYPCTYQLPPI